jgi:uncharacterized membrane protein YqjE
VIDTRETSPDEQSGAGLLHGLMRSLGVLLQAHLQHAQREASTDIGRLVAGVFLIGAAGLFLGLAVMLAELAAVVATTALLRGDRLGALLIVGAGNLLLTLLLALWARAKLRRPLLRETRELLRRTVSSLTQS